MNLMKSVPISGPPRQTAMMDSGSSKSGITTVQLGLEHYTLKISWKNEITTPKKIYMSPLKRDHFKKERIVFQPSCLREHIFHVCNLWVYLSTRISLRSWMWKPAFTGRQNWRLCKRDMGGRALGLAVVS